MNAAYTNSSVANFSAPAFAVDGVGDIWTIAADANGQTSIEATNGPDVCSSILDSFYVQSGTHTALAPHGPWIAFGATNSVSWALSG